MYDEECRQLRQGEWLVDPHSGLGPGEGRAHGVILQLRQDARCPQPHNRVLKDILLHDKMVYLHVESHV